MADNNDNSEQKNIGQSPIDNGESNAPENAPENENAPEKKKRSNFHIRTLTAIFIAVRRYCWEFIFSIFFTTRL